MLDRLVPLPPRRTGPIPENLLRKQIKGQRRLLRNARQVVIGVGLTIHPCRDTVPITTYARRFSVEAYCMKCREKREMKNPQQITMKNGRPATQGTCPCCGTKMFRIGKGGS